MPPITTIIYPLYWITTSSRAERKEIETKESLIYELENRINEGEDFAQLARENSGGQPSGFRREI